MSYDLITKYRSSNCGYDPHYHSGGNNPKEIIVHHWGVDGQSFDGVCRWLCRDNGDTSAQYVVEAGKVAKLMEETDCAWHAGNKAVNMTSIGIECRPECYEGDFDTLVELVADIYRRRGVLPIRGHKDIGATACPGRYYARLTELKNKAVALLSDEKQAAAPAKAPTKSPAKLDAASLKKGKVTSFQKWLNSNWNLDIAEDGIWGSDTNDAAIKSLQHLVGCEADGIVGDVTRSLMPDLSRGDEGQLVHWLQGVCSKFGYYDVEQDGVFGGKTETAVKTFQKAKALTVDGIAGVNTITAMLQ